MRIVTLCFLLTGTHICLAKKKIGFGEGKYNGAGGKVEQGEEIDDAAIREVEEEIGVRIPKEKLEKVGVLTFYFDKASDINQCMHIYKSSVWEGDPCESDEMCPEWFHQNDIPLDNMWLDDKYWIPKMLNNEWVEGSFYFNVDGSEILKYELLS